MNNYICKCVYNDSYLCYQRSQSSYISHGYLATQVNTDFLVSKFIFFTTVTNVPTGSTVTLVTKITNLPSFLPSLFTYLLTPCNTVLLHKLKGSQLVKRFPAFYGISRFITAFTRALQLSLILIQTNMVHANHSIS